MLSPTNPKSKIPTAKWARPLPSPTRKSKTISKSSPLTSRRSLDHLEHHVNRQKLSRPSLKITRQVDQKDAGAFSFEVWNPFTGLYQPVDSVQDGLRRVADLAALI